MYHSTGVGKLSEAQKSKRRNGHPVRIKLGSGNSLNLTENHENRKNKKLNSTRESQTKKILEFHARFTKIMKILEFNARILKI